MRRIGAWLELGRVSNLPTVLTNALAGAAVATPTGEPLDWTRAAWAILALGAMYTSGMILNDAYDTDVDARERPSRPVPSGRISRRAAWIAGIAMLIAGAAGLFAVRTHAGLLGLGLAGAIGAYTGLHRAWAGSVVVMGACRMLVYPIAASAVAGSETDTAWWVGGVVGVYTVLLSLVARGEAQRIGSSAPAWLALAAVPALAMVLQPPDTPAIATGAAVLAWLAVCARRVSKGRVVPGVLGMLAGFCLIDAFVLMLAGFPRPAAGAVALFVVVVIGHRRILGT